MVKRTIADAVITVMEGRIQPMTAAEITVAIQERNLYQFNSKAPRDIVRSAIERHCEGVTRKSSATQKLFKKHSPGSYSLMPRV